ncbi:MAG: FAD-dependent oxidoreductase, partial [Candidatus Omnitrophica bacterium]|nr:FAD-dependent oxidoreductase [Candidatus Omnitrophota bacterium]
MAHEIEAAFIQKIKRTPTIYSFRFSADDDLNFKPGQYMEVMLDKIDKELRHYLSFSSSPDKDYFEFTKRLSDSRFSQKLSQLKDNSTVLFKLPLGSCVYKEEYKKIAFLIGGIGVTPAISMIEYVVENNLDTDVVVFYSNRTKEEIAFYKELKNWQSLSKKLKVILTVTDDETSGPQYLKGRIDKDIIKSNMGDILERIFFIFGPPKMVDAMKAIAVELGVENNNIKTEYFIG